MPDRPTRVLVVTDHSDATPELLEAVRARAQQGPAQFRLLVPNPARAEVHLRHPERHEKAEAAEQVLNDALPAFREAAGNDVLGSVSIRHDPFDAIEETLHDEPIDEFIIAIAPHGLSKVLHQDLVHRLAHFGLPVTSVATHS
ncbi:MAG: hypothetical protein JWM40_2442 [Frankiales bacterium]|nr:hypothetical protein [Frankiales bacterium]